MTDSISRKEFLMKMGFKGAALMAVLTSCSKDNVNAQISPFTIDLSATTSAALKNVGGYIKTNGVVLARIATGDVSTSFAAIARICPHENKDKIVYQTAQGRFHCTEHDWYFKTNGAGIGNGSTTAYTISLSGTTLSIS
jgi:cytochrome b6-f complex iron-sulfur subunit